MTVGRGGASSVWLASPRSLNIMNKENIKVFVFVVIALISVIVIQSCIWINTGP